MGLLKSRRSLLRGVCCPVGSVRSGRAGCILNLSHSFSLPPRLSSRPKEGRMSSSLSERRRRFLLSYHPRFPPCLRPLLSLPSFCPIRRRSGRRGLFPKHPRPILYFPFRKAVEASLIDCFYVGLLPLSLSLLPLLVCVWAIPTDGRRRFHMGQC